MKQPDNSRTMMAAHLAKTGRKYAVQAKPATLKATCPNGTALLAPLKA